MNTGISKMKNSSGKMSNGRGCFSALENWSLSVISSYSIEQFLIAISCVLSDTEEPESIIICTDVPQSSPITVTNLFTNADTRVTSVGLTGY